MQSSLSSPGHPRTSTRSKSSCGRTGCRSSAAPAGSACRALFVPPSPVNNTHSSSQTEKEPTTMATIHRDGDLALLDGRVAVVGFGSQGHAHALNLHDSGVDVVVGLREGSGSRAAVEEAGVEAASIPDAVRGAQLVAILVPDHVQQQVWQEEVAPNLSPGAAVLFAHGLNIHFGRIVPPAEHDVIMVAPKAPGHRVRELFRNGAGTPGL